MKQDNYRATIHEILEKVSDRALTKLVKMIPDNRAMEWYVAFSLSCPVWYVVDFVRPDDLLPFPVKQQRKALDCLGMMTFLPTVLWGSYLQYQVQDHASKLKAQRKHAKEIRAARRASYSGGVSSGPVSAD